MMQQQQPQTSKRPFTASEVAEFEYCPLVWWHEQFEPLAQTETEEQFARLVELEHEHDSEAPALPEYQMIERLLVRRGAFDEGRQQHLEHAAAVDEAEEERINVPSTIGRRRVLLLLVVAMLVLAVVVIAAAILIRL